MSKRSAVWRLAAATSTAAMILTGPAHAEDWAREVGGWTVGRSGDFCAMGKEYAGEGSTELTLLITDDAEKTYLRVDNYAWSATTDQTYSLRYELSDWAYTMPAIGTNPRRGRKGFMSMVSSDFLADFAKASGLQIMKEDLLVDSLNLNGSAAGLSILQRCRTELARDLQQQRRERERLAHIPVDPFASSVGATPSVSARGPRLEVASRLAARIQENYPSRALREGIEGRVGIRAAVGANGRVTSCAVTSSSGSAILDAAACDGMTRYARFEPAIGDDGQPTTGMISDTIVYQLDRGVGEVEPLTEVPPG